MVWTYDDRLPSTRDKLRLLIGDTDVNDQQMQDAGVDYLLAEESSIYAAAAAACRAIAALYSRRVDFSNSSLSLAASQRVAHYTGMAAKYEARARAGSSGGNIGSPIVGGVSIDAIAEAKADTDLVQPRFRHDMQDFAEAEPE